jgi:hypothetical protein
MNEEQAILDFFAQPENLPLGLSVAEQMDKLREQMNNRLWLNLHSRLEKLIQEHGLAWLLETTEDRNAPDCLVGLHCNVGSEQVLSLLPMVEQQSLGGEWRIYYGLMWSAAPSPEQLEIVAVKKLKASLQNAGFKNNERFLAWQWTAFHPRRKDFLMRYAHRPEQLLDEMEAILKKLLVDFGSDIAQTNEVLRINSPRSLHSSLQQLRNELLDD